jgi:hypothetical protein
MRKFGIELETYRLHTTDPVQILQGLGLQAVRANYSARNYAVWQCKDDGSIRGVNGPLPRGHAGIEIVSPVLAADPSSYTEIANVANALKAADFKVNRTCGFHVHISLADLSPVQRMAVLLRFALMQGEFDAMVPRSRVGNMYAAAFDAPTVNTLAVRTASGTAWHPSSRYWTLNPTYLFTRGTLEFRQAAGTVEAEKIVMWVKLLQQMIDEAVRQLNTAAPVRRIRPRAGSLTSKMAAELARTGRLSREWMATEGVQESHLTSNVAWMRRRGAQLRTRRTPMGLEYTTVDGHAKTWDELHGTTAAPTTQGLANPRSTMNFPLLQGVEADVQAWVAARRARFSPVQP